MKNNSKKTTKYLLASLILIIICSIISFFYSNNISQYTRSIFSSSTNDSIVATYSSNLIAKASNKIKTSKGDFDPNNVAISNINETTISKITKRNSQDSINGCSRILMLGDSHLMGQFGEFLQHDLHETGLFDILSISIGGAGSLTFTYPMHNNCCGYIIRESVHNEKIEANKNIRRLEYKNRKTSELIGKKYNGLLKNVIGEISPDIVIVALGSNFTNNHQGLINLIKENAPNSQIVWVGPMRCKNIGIRVKTIQQTVVKNNIFFVRSDDFVGSEDENMEHLCGVEAKNWAYTIFERMKPLIDRYSNSIAHNQTQRDSLKN